jgi:hypothetical protein
MKPLLIFLMFMLFLFNRTIAQSCGTCSVSINSLDSANYTVNTGETFCVDSTGNFVGSITLNGGSICNKGLFAPKSLIFSNGTITNYGNASIKSSLTFGSSSQLDNNGGGIINISGNLTISGGSIANDGIVNIDQAIQNTSGSLQNSNIINCTQISGSGTLNNTGVINSN